MVIQPASWSHAWWKTEVPNEKAEMSSDELNLVEGAGLFALVPVGSIQADRVRFPHCSVSFHTSEMSIKTT